MAQAPSDSSLDVIPDLMYSRVRPGWSSPGSLTTWRYDRIKRQYNTYLSDGSKMEELKVIQFDQQRVVLKGRLLIGPTGGSD